MGIERKLTTVSLLVDDYDTAIAYYVGTLNWLLIEDTVLDESTDKRWVVVSPSHHSGAKLLLAKADGPQQVLAIGNQTGGRVGFFLQTDNLQRDYTSWLARGVEFLEQPRQEPYGEVVVFKDAYGNLWDLIQTA